MDLTRMSRSNSHKGPVQTVIVNGKAVKIVSVSAPKEFFTAGNLVMREKTNKTLGQEATAK